MVDHRFINQREKWQIPGFMIDDRTDPRKKKNTFIRPSRTFLKGTKVYFRWSAS